MKTFIFVYERLFTCNLYYFHVFRSDKDANLALNQTDWTLLDDVSLVDLFGKTYQMINGTDSPTTFDWKSVFGVDKFCSVRQVHYWRSTT